MLAARTAASVGPQSGSKQWRSFSRWASLAVGLGFFFPWFTVSCAGVQLTFSGFDLAIGPTINAGFGATQHLAASPILWIILLGALAGFAITFGSAKGKTIAWTVLGSGIASLLVLLLTWLSFSDQRSPYIQVTTDLGLWISVLGVGGMLYGGGTGVGQSQNEDR